MALGLAGACSSTDDSPTSVEDLTEEGGTITVGFANEQPYAFRADGELTGEAPALHREIFSRMGDIEVEGKQMDFNSLIPALKAGDIDVVSAGMFITPERCAEALFSNPEYVAKTALMVKEGNPEDLSDLESVAESGARLAVMRGAVEADQARAAGVKDGRLETVADQQSGLDALNAGRADAFALTDISLNWMAKDTSGVEVLGSFTPVVDGEEQLGAGAAVFRKDDTELRDAFNEELAGLLEEDGTWTDLVGEFGFTEDNKPPADLTAEDFCGA